MWSFRVSYIRVSIPLIIALILVLSVGIAVTSASDSPTAEFEISPSEPEPDEEIVIDASMSEALAGEIESYDWSIDRGWSGPRWPSGEEISGSFDEYGDYEIELEVTDNNGSTDTIIYTVTVDG